MDENHPTEATTLAAILQASDDNKNLGKYEIRDRQAIK